ncbi:hypothetical protein CBER1_00401 [Cercospora berteroae]|uniref:Uncharacterized protein n=1 Tax=Cercospora berteroae TaxID=357750 RepID=A0A2S6C1H6_9PEZI|nr:hypothetical protein CBER1_00401 [Cercospora berteroae]
MRLHPLFLLSIVTLVAAAPKGTDDDPNSTFGIDPYKLCQDAYDDCLDLCENTAGLSEDVCTPTDQCGPNACPQPPE